MKTNIHLLLFLFLSCNFGFSQDTSEIIDAYEDFADLSREQIYVHFNKTTYITGEMLGFNAYVFLKDIKQPSTNTANLYCQILDKNDKVLREKLIMMNQGVSRGDFMIDSTFVSGEYQFKVYTNWSRNFNNEHTYFLEKFNVINPEDKVNDKPIDIDKTIDIQVLPESGHLLSETLNVVGVIAKDKLGLGVPNLKIDILNKNGDVLTSTTLNKFGIGQFLFFPTEGEDYSLEYFYNDSKVVSKLEQPERTGILLSIKDITTPNSIGVTLKTNDIGLENFGNKNFKLVIHNGANATEAILSLNGAKESITTVDHSYLYEGVNILTLFDEEDRPIAERLYFNFEGLPLNSVTKASVNQVQNDSLEITLKLPTIDAQLFQNLSISVLPSETRSYAHHQNIISAIYLQPYLKSAVEQASYYFTDITEKKKYELDNLLLTQGWSSYDWTTIFNAPPEPVYDFEVGISYTINANTSSGKNLFIYPNINTGSEILSLTEGQKSFEKRGFFPLDDEKIRIGETKRNGNVGQSNVVLQFSPSKIIDFKTAYQPKTTLRANQYATSGTSDFKFDDIESLDEVILYAKKKYTRIEKLQNKTLGKVIDFGEHERQFYRTFAQFISERGFLVDETMNVNEASQESSRFRIKTRAPVSINATDVPLIYLDDVILVDLDVLYKFSMEVVDYVEVNKGGIGGGIRGAAGIIKIYTDPHKKFKVKTKVSFTQYNIPLTYTTPKRFYVPKYSVFDSKFFKEYGVIDWIPNARFDTNGELSLKVLNTKSPIRLYVEGIVNSQELMSQQIEVTN
ncbi:hypothetical protein [uncultured Psychroserpens sp.]|uniref:hypothetical protein n=1 Tax=uncultured Psychroserpens sp. TaxID=255436 RepID=UPI00261EEE70|nr:hypothetical protein [uncultured Psychroserpens sp.]